MNNLYQKERIVADEVQLDFSTAEEFMDFLNALDKESRWIEVASNAYLSASYAGDKEDVIEGLTDETFNDTVKNGTQLALDVNGERFYVGATALPTMKARAGVSGASLEKIKREELVKILNTCFPVASGGALVRICGDKVRACHSKNYQILPQSTLFRIARTEIEAYSNKTFASGIWSHDYTTAAWDIHDKDVSEAYAELFREQGIPVKEDKIQTRVSINTSDVGTSGATVWYSVSYENKSLVLGSGYKLNHKGDADVQKFADNLRDIFAVYKKKFYDIQELRNVQVLHPAGCILGLCAKADLPKKLAKEAAIRFINNFGNAETDGLILYVFGISELLTIAEERKTCISTLLTYQEKLARIIGLDFKKFDEDADIFDVQAD